MNSKEKRDIITRAVKIASTMPDNCYQRLSVEKDIFVIKIENRSFIGSTDFPKTKLWIDDFKCFRKTIERLHVVELFHKKTILDLL